jgi:hypothetical protein
MQKTILVAALLLPLGLLAGASANPTGQCVATSFVQIGPLPQAVTVPASAWGSVDFTADTFYIDDRGGAAIAQLPANTNIPGTGLPVTGYVGNNRPGYTDGNGLWVYAETNGVAGLQRGGGSVLNPTGAPVLTPDNDFPACNNASHDTLIF